MKTRILYFIGGVVAATIAKLASGCPKVREMAVHGLAKGMQTAEKAKEHLHHLKEEAETMCKEAQEHNHHSGTTCEGKSCEKPTTPNP